MTLVKDCRGGDGRWDVHVKKKKKCDVLGLVTLVDFQGHMNVGRKKKLKLYFPILSGAYLAFTHSFSCVFDKFVLRICCSHTAFCLVFIFVFLTATFEPELVFPVFILCP